MEGALTILFISVCSLLFSQQSKLICNGFEYNQDYGIWSDRIMDYKCDYYEKNNWNKLRTKDTAFVNKIKNQISTRAGREFSNQLDLKAILVSRHPQKCNNIKYTF